MGNSLHRRRAIALHSDYSSSLFYIMTASSDSKFKQNYQAHLQHLKLKSLQPKTIEAYSRAIRRTVA